MAYYININGQVKEVSEQEYRAYNLGTPSNPAGSGDVTQLNNTQTILNPNTTNNIPGNRLPTLSEQIAAAGLSPPASQLSAADQANIDALNRIEANRAQPGSTGSLPTQEDFAALRQAQIDRNGGVDPNAVPPDVQAQLDRINAREPGPATFSLPTQADFAALRQAQIDRNGGVDPNAVPPDVQAQLDRINAREPGPPLGTLSEQLAAAGLSAPPSQLDQGTIDALNRIEANRAQPGSDGSVPTQADFAALRVAQTNPTPFDPNQDEFGNLGAAQEAAAARAPETLSPADVQAGLDDALANQSSSEDTEPRVFTAEDLGVEVLSDEAILAQQQQQAANRAALQSEDSFQAAQEAAVRERAKQQATFQARYKQPGNQDWRVRLSLGPNANYLYNAGTPRGSGAGILAPLAKTDGVIFPYTPNITTTYSANYEQYDLVHSNYRGLFYKNSRVGDIQLRGTFTAQDTNEANYLLAVIHFFRSATKMFYGQDAERGTPPPVCLLNGLGTYQFSDHPVVISSFNYTTPNDVDYIRATNPNNYGSNLLNRRTAVASNPGGSSIAGLNRLLNAVQNGLSKGAIPNVPAPGSVNQSVNNTAGATYVPTKMEIDITLIPVQTRSQVSKQFSLKGFANGDLLKGGFW